MSNSMNNSNQLITQYGLYHNGKLICPYDKKEDAENAAKSKNMISDGIYEVKKIKQMPK